VKVSCNFESTVRKETTRWHDWSFQAACRCWEHWWQPIHYASNHLLCLERTRQKAGQDEVQTRHQKVLLQSACGQLLE